MLNYRVSVSICRPLSHQLLLWPQNTSAKVIYSKDKSLNKLKLCPINYFHFNFRVMYGHFLFEVINWVSIYLDMHVVYIV